MPFLLVIHRKVLQAYDAIVENSQTGGHHSKEEFAVRGKEPKDEVQIYTWKDATLRELTDLVC